MIKYRVSLENANQHLINVCMTITQPLKKGQEFWLPDWIPGSYMIRDFSRNIVTLKAKENSHPIQLLKKSKSTWLLQQDVKELRVNYQVYAWDLSVRSAHFDDQHCFFNGTSLFVALRGKEELSHQVEIVASKFASMKDWKVATSMSQVHLDPKGFGTYQSVSYADLIDHPFEIADFIEVGFIVDKVEHKMVFAEAPKNIDLERIAKDVQRICQYECSFFGDEKPPFNRYLFMTFVQKKGFGGLEHLSSTALHCSHDDLPIIGEDKEKKSADYQKFLSLCCHEYFHCWNVKRMKPAKFESYKLQQEVNTELLWFFEGITSYYDELFLIRAGVITSENYLDMLAKNITRYMRGSGRLKQSVTESSFDAWTKFYQQDENASNAIVSYYVKGALVAFCLDFEIRKLTNNKHNLDDLMRFVWKEYGKKSNGVEEKDIQKATELLVGKSMQDFFEHILYSTEELDLELLFEQMDVCYQLLPESKEMEKGGYTKTKIKTKPTCSLGINHKSNSGGAEIVSVFDGGCGSSGGLSSGDIIIAIDGYKVESSELDKTIAKFPLGSKIEISFFRRDKLYQRSIQLNPTQANTCYLSFNQSKPSEKFNEWVNLENSIET